MVYWDNVGVVIVAWPLLVIKWTVVQKSPSLRGDGDHDPCAPPLSNHRVPTVAFEAAALRSKPLRHA